MLVGAAVEIAILLVVGAIVYTGYRFALYLAIDAPPADKLQKKIAEVKTEVDASEQATELELARLREEKVSLAKLKSQFLGETPVEESVDHE